MANKTHASNGQELSDNELFIADDGKLSLYNGDTECEIVALSDNIFFGLILLSRAK
ncbi:MAG: hypothetical protein ACW98D_17925 [Promethearchaeota archaeon]|jgi:hypothetical protein